ncbi:HEPN domain-containing protein [Mesobacillus foraminis]|uniref:ApeA N-terminal domain 1-containing protein n=1 Tax=Mesobacillus foraminis TaxID=279826 RepID=UPI00399F5E25
MAGTKAMKQTLFDEFQIKGYWWLPSSNEKVSGILFYKHDKIELELIGRLHSDDELEGSRFFGRKNSSHECILGFTDKGEEITLIDAINSNFSISAPGFATETYSINLFIVGGHYENSNNIMFHSMSFFPTNFTKWLGKIPFKQSHLFEDEVFKGVEKIEFPKPSMFSEYVKSIDSVIEETYNSYLKGDYTKDIHWLYEGGLKIVPNDLMSLEWFEKKMFSLRNLLTLFMGIPTYFEKIIYHGDEYSLEGREDKKFRKKHALFFKQNEIRLPKKYNIHDVMINYGDIKDNLGFVFNNWFSKHEDLKTVLDLYFSDFYSKMYLESKFLNAVQTLEIYHRTLGEGTIMDYEKYEKYCLELKELIQPKFEADFVDLIEGKLTHGNEITLSKRIKALINKLSDENKRKLFGNSDSRNKFVQQLVDTRNYLTHYDKSNKKTVLEEPNDLYIAIEKLKGIATIIIFKELGVDEELIINKILDNKRYSHAFSL